MPACRHAHDHVCTYVHTAYLYRICTQQQASRVVRQRTAPYAECGFCHGLCSKHAAQAVLPCRYLGVRAWVRASARASPAKPSNFSRKRKWLSSAGVARRWCACSSCSCFCVALACRPSSVTANRSRRSVCVKYLRTCSRGVGVGGSHQQVPVHKKALLRAHAPALPRPHPPRHIARQDSSR